MKLTAIDKLVLEHGADGRPVAWGWSWTCCGRRVARNVDKLRRAGLVDVTYFNGYAAAHPNPGALLAKGGVK